MPEAEPRDAPGVVTLPPLIYGAFFLLGLGLEYMWPTSVAAGWIGYLAGGSLAAASFAFAIPAIWHFRKAGTHLDVRRPTTAIVVAGPFRYSRNPIYLALTLLYLGLGVGANSLWVLGLVFPVLAVMHVGVIAREERYLERKFGEEYLTYKRAVRRWI